jgi:hypothetical protein
MIYRFKDFVYEKPYAPYYDSYREHLFEIDHYSEQDESKQHVWLTCVSNPAIIVAGYVELHQLEEANQ